MDRLSTLAFSTLLYGIALAMKFTAWRQPAFRERLKEQNLTGQIRVKAGTGRYYVIKDGKISSRPGIHPNPDVVVTVKSARLGLQIFTHPNDQLGRINAAKSFSMTLDGPQDKAIWFMFTLESMLQAGWRYGVDLGQGETRYVNMANGGPLFVYVKDGKIVRMTPIEFDDRDPQPWTIKAKGKEFTPPRKTSLAPHGQTVKSTIYSPDRILYPMKRVDFDPNGERNPQNRGVSGYERISWDEALDIVANEIKRQKTVHGNGAIACSHPSHHAWGNIGYYLSALRKFENAVGMTEVHHNPDSWEGWYWGATHHWGGSMRVGQSETYGTVEDCLKEAEMVVFWSSNPESNSGAYGALEGTIRRQWLKDAGIKLVHIDPYYNDSIQLLGGKWIAPRPTSSPALAIAIAYVWITEGTYDKSYVSTHTHGFDKWADYVLGKDDGIPKSPEWQEAETGVPASDVRALAREWASKKTYLGAGAWGNGHGGACRNATGIQWARTMVCLIAMQGLGKPGVNMGNLQWGTPLDFNFYFPGYAEGGMSGDYSHTAMGVTLYQRMPQLPSINTNTQVIPRMQLPEAIIDGKAEGYVWNGSSIEAQFQKITYPKPGFSPVHMLWKYGGSLIASMPNSSRYINMFRHPNLEFLVSQNIWLHGDTEFADIILPACTNFERYDISEWAGLGGYAHHGEQQLNHRVITFQHKCIEPLGESKSDFWIFQKVCERLGLAAYFTEGVGELGWVKRQFDGSDLPKHISWKEFIRKGYFVVPTEKEEQRAPLSWNWFYEGRKKDVPEPMPLPSDYSQGYLKGLQTQTGKIEFDCESLKRFDPLSEDRPPIAKYQRPAESPNAKGFEDFPLQLISPHPRFSFHTQMDGKDSFLNDIPDHRVLVDGYYYWVLRIHPDDAKTRGIRDNDLVRLYNARGSVVCAAKVTHRLLQGVVHAYGSSGVYDPVGEPGKSTDRGGCVNLLSSSKSQIGKAHSMGASCCQIEVERWNVGEVAMPAPKKRNEPKNEKRSRHDRGEHGLRLKRMKKWNLIVDVAKCTNCNLCTLANQDEHVGNEFEGYAAPMPRHGHRWIDIRSNERGSGPVMDVAYLPVMCQHCDDAPCMKAAKNGAVTKRADGIVHIDPVKAKGQKAIADACPYGAVRWNEELQLPQHWFFDAHLLDRGWKEPRCVTVCATGALKSVKVTDEEMAAIKSREGLRELQPEWATKARVHYKNLNRYTHEFVGGTIIKTVNGVTDCVADARVRLEKSGAVVGEAITDAYGEFKIDGLKPDSGRYGVVIEVAGRVTKRLDVELKKSVYVGRIELAA